MTSAEAATINQRLDGHESTLTNIDEKVSKLLQSSIRQVTVCENSRKDLAEVRRTVFGNGDVGLKTRVDRLEGLSGLRSKAFWVIVGVAGTIASGLTVAGATWALKFV